MVLACSSLAGLLRVTQQSSPFMLDSQ